MDWEDFISMQAGYFDRLASYERMIRTAVRVIIAPWVKNAPSEFQLYYVRGDEKLKALIKEYNKTVQVSEKSMAILKAFKDAEAKQKSKDN